MSIWSQKDDKFWKLRNLLYSDPENMHCHLGSWIEPVKWELFAYVHVYSYIKTYWKINQRWYFKESNDLRIVQRKTIEVDSFVPTGVWNLHICCLLWSLSKMSNSTRCLISSGTASKLYWQISGLFSFLLYNYLKLT